MVDVSAKTMTRRVAEARAEVVISRELAAAIQEDRLTKGNLLTVARLAGIQGAKQTANLIPLCHQLPLDQVHVEAKLETNNNENLVIINTQAITTWKTGVEMEAFTAASVAALTVIDMGKAIDKNMTIRSIQLLKKTGGKSGDYQRQENT